MTKQDLIAYLLTQPYVFDRGTVDYEGDISLYLYGTEDEQVVVSGPGLLEVTLDFWEEGYEQLHSAIANLVPANDAKQELTEQESVDALADLVGL